jgi:lambda family phage tail tape measure protein
MIKELEDANGFLLKSMTILENTVEGQFKNMYSNVQATLIKVSKESQGALIDLAHSIKAAFTSDSVVSALSTIGSSILGLTKFLFDHATAVKVVVGAYLGFHTLRIAASLVIPVVSGLTTAYLTFATAASTSAAVTGILAAAKANLGTQSKNAAFGVSILNAAIKANPYTAIASVIATVAAAYFLMRDGSTAASNAMDASARSAKDVATEVGKGIDNLRRQNEQLEIELGLRQNLEIEKRNSLASTAALATAAAEKAMRDPAVLRGSKQTAGNRALGQMFGNSDSQAYLSAVELQKQAAAASTALKVYDALSQRNKVLVGEARKKKEAELAAEAERARKAAGGKLLSLDPDVLKAPGRAGSGGSWLPKLTKEFQEDIANYSSTLSNIAKVESDALAVAKAQRDAGFMAEADYLTKRNTLRKEADDKAAAELNEYVAAQKKAWVGALNNLTTINEKEEAALLVKENQTAERTKRIRADAEAAREAQINSANKAQAAIKAAEDAASVRTSSGGQQGTLDALGAFKDKFGDHDAQIKNANEMLRAITTETEAIKNLTTAERDKNIVAMEGDLARMNMAITSAEVDKGTLSITDAQIQALREKRDTLMDVMGKYAAQVSAQKELEDDWLHGAKKGLLEYGKTATSAAKTAEAAMTRAFKSMEDALVEFAMTGKMNFGDFARSVIADMVRMQVQQSITRPLAGIGSNLLGSLFGSVGATSVAAAGQSSYLSGNEYAAAAAQGGVFGGAGISAYENSVVSKPTLFPFAHGIGLMGEKPGSPGEAIMPLTRMPGGDLGVKVDGGGAGGVIVEQHITIDARGADAGVDQKIYLAMRRAKDEAVAAVAEQFRRGGPMARAVRSA